MPPILAIVDIPVDGDSVWLAPTDAATPRFIARIGGVDTPSSGRRAVAGKALIRSWKGRRVLFYKTCCGRPHGEVPGVIVDALTREPLGRLLVAEGHASRWQTFPIDPPSTSSALRSVLPSLTKFKL